MRPAQAIIDLASFKHNYLLSKKLAKAKALAVIKADAYGHGAIKCAKYLADVADGFAVACIEEAIILRQNGITAPILLLEGFFNADELPLIAKLNLWTVIHANWQIEMLAKSNLAQKLNVWLKMDSGMHRVGIEPKNYLASYQQLASLENVAHITLMSHFACADEPQNNYSAKQIMQFKQVTSNLNAPISFKNSAAILANIDAPSAWVRPGIMLYGASPLANCNADLKTVMTLQTQIIGIRQIAVGEAVGYGMSFTADKPMLIGTAAIGYADGYPRQVPSGTKVAVNGSLSQIIGRVSMDMLSLDLTNIPNAQIGSKVELWGEQIAVNEIAKAAGTIAYQLFCNLKRIPKIYLS